MMSSRTLGTSAKKKRAKNPATPPKPAAMVPLFCVSVHSEIWEVKGVDIQLDQVAGGDAVEVTLDGVSAVAVSWPVMRVLSPISAPSPLKRSFVAS